MDERQKKWLLSIDIVILALLIAFVCDMWVGSSPPPPYRDQWGLEWPPFAGEQFVGIPDWVRAATFYGIFLSGGVLVVYGLYAIGSRLRAIVAGNERRRG